MADTITVTGVVGTDPQLGDAGGTPVCNFRLASSLRRYDKQAGKWTEYGTNWYSVGAYRYLGKNVAASLHKGDRVVVTGRIRLREWSNQTGRGMTIDIDASSVGHDLTWGTTTFHKHNEGQTFTETEPETASAEEENGFPPASFESVPEPVSDPAAPLVETSGGPTPEGWATASVGTDSHAAA